MRTGPGRESGEGSEPWERPSRQDVPRLAPQGCYEKVKMWFDENKHVLGTVGMCILIMQVSRSAPVLHLT